MLYKFIVYLADVVSDLILILAISKTLHSYEMQLSEDDLNNIETTLNSTTRDSWTMFSIDSNLNSTINDTWTKFASLDQESWSNYANCTMDSDGKTLAENIKFLRDVLEKYQYQLILAFTFSTCKQILTSINYIQVCNYIKLQQ